MQLTPIVYDRNRKPDHAGQDMECLAWRTSRRSSG
jgi:hypothetical protein